MIARLSVEAICELDRLLKFAPADSRCLRCRSETLVAGNVITIEPGCYVPADPSYPKHFHGLGIRIEVCRRQRTGGHR